MVLPTMECQKQNVPLYPLVILNMISGRYFTVFSGYSTLIDFARVIGSKIQVAGWTIYSALIWSLKLSMLYFYTRLTVSKSIKGFYISLLTL